MKNGLGKTEPNNNLGDKMNIVYGYVCGDILHEGHLLHLQNAKGLGDKLIVGVLTDEAVKEKKKAPTLDFRERASIVQKLGFVDAVVAQDEYSPIKNIKLLKPDVLMESASHSEEDLRTIKKVCKNLGTRVVVMPYYPCQSSTAIKEKIKEDK